MRPLCLLIPFLCLTARTAPAKPERQAEQPIRVACVGNSVTYGYGLQEREREAYPARLQEMLGNAYEVANFGRSGATLLYKGHRPYISLPEFRQALDFRPDWVVIHLGLNDTDPRDWPDWKEEFIPNYRALIDSFLVVNPEARILVCKMTPIFDRHPRFQSSTREWHAQIQEAIEKVAFGAKAQLIDLYSPLHSRPDLFPDALHPNAEGAQIMARTVYSALTGDYGGLQLPVIYGNGMVMQRDEPVLLPGSADARQHIQAKLKQEGKVVRESETFSQADGTWEIQLGGWPAGGPYELTVTSEPLPPDHYQLYYPSHYPFSLSSLTRRAKQSLTLDSIYFGDVWLASGQSNMELRVDECDSQQADLADAARLGQRLHLFNIPARARTDAVTWTDSVLHFVNKLDYMDPQDWHAASPQTVAAFSAVAFNFGRVLCDSLADVPIGIICNAVGGSTTESWIDRSTLEAKLPTILHNWREGDYGQPWARGRMTQNIALALQKDSTSYNPLQRHPYEPCYLFEAAIRPLAHFPLKGVIWYQGESNAHNTELHDRLFRLLEQSWRREFKRAWHSEFQKHPPLPFYTVQLSSLPRPSWPAFRDGQRRLTTEMPQTWMTVTSDLGDQADVHYRAKRPVGERLALQALHHTYGHPLVSEGPMPVEARAINFGSDKVIAVIRFENADGLSVSRGFELAGQDGIFHPADVEIHGRTVHLSSPDVHWPAAVRYGWSGFTDADMHNAQGLPASTFCIQISNNILWKRE